MNKETVSAAITGIDNKYIDEAAMYTPTTASQKPRQIKWIALAASLVFIMFIGIATSAFITENRTYNKAIAYFETTGLSAEGLSRSEVKAVYRDITLGSFSNIKTSEVIWQSFENNK